MYKSPVPTLKTPVHPSHQPKWFDWSGLHSCFRWKWVVLVGASELWAHRLRPKMVPPHGVEALTLTVANSCFPDLLVTSQRRSLHHMQRSPLTTHVKRVSLSDTSSLLIARSCFTMKPQISQNLPTSPPSGVSSCRQRATFEGRNFFFVGLSWHVCNRKWTRCLHHTTGMAETLFCQKTCGEFHHRKGVNASWFMQLSFCICMSLGPRFWMKQWSK